MYEQGVKVVNATGLHARPASQLTQLCKKFPEKITIVTPDKSVDPKSIISLLSGGVKAGTTVTVRVEGENEEAVAKEVCTFISNLTD